MAEAAGRISQSVVQQLPGIMAFDGSRPCWVRRKTERIVSTGGLDGGLLELGRPVCMRGCGVEPEWHGGDNGGG